MLIGRYLVRFYTFESQKVDNPNAGVVEPIVLTQKQLRRNRFSHIAKTTKRYKTKVEKKCYSTSE
jgi:hypothetical protein